MVIFANFTTGANEKLRITSIKQFLDGFYLMKMIESMKANGFLVRGD